MFDLTVISLPQVLVPAYHKESQGARAGLHDGDESYATGRT